MQELYIVVLYTLSIIRESKYVMFWNLQGSLLPESTGRSFQVVWDFLAHPGRFRLELSLPLPCPLEPLPHVFSIPLSSTPLGLDLPMLLPLAKSGGDIPTWLLIVESCWFWWFLLILWVCGSNNVLVAFGRVNLMKDVSHIDSLMLWECSKNLYYKHILFLLTCCFLFYRLIFK